MKSLVVFMLFFVVATPIVSAASNPFASYLKKIAKYEKDLKEEDDPKKQAKIETKLEKEKKKFLDKYERVVKPLDKKIDSLYEDKEKLEAKGKGTKKIDADIKKLEDKRQLIEEQAYPKEKKEAEKKEAEKAADKGKKALDGML